MTAFLQRFNTSAIFILLDYDKILLQDSVFLQTDPFIFYFLLNILYILPDSISHLFLQELATLFNVKYAKYCLCLGWQTKS